jgi:signal transduction histidine kinase/streptogramin lyase
VLYYRLRQLALDGTASYSPVWVLAAGPLAPTARQIREQLCPYMRLPMPGSRFPPYLAAVRRWLLLCFFGWLLPALSMAAPTPGGGWLPDAALSSLMLRTLVQTPDGLLWVGTDDGAYRYDGTQLVTLNALRRHGPALPTVPCNFLLPLPNGQLWLGTDAGLFCFGTDGRLRALPLPLPGHSSHTIEALVLAPDSQHVWVHQRGAGQRRYALNGQPDGPLLRQAQPLLEVWAAPDGTLWTVGSTTRQLGADGQLLAEWPNADQLGLHPVYDPAGRPWLLSTTAAYRPGPDGRLREAYRWGSATGETWAEVQRTATGPAVLARGQVQQLEWTACPDPHLRLRFTLPLPPWPTAGWGGRLQADRAGHWWVFDANTRGCWHREAAPAFIHALPGPGGRPYSVRSSVRLPDGRLLVSSYEAGLLVQPRDSPLAPLRRWPAATLPGGNAPVLMGILPAALGPGGDWLAVGAYPFLRFNPRTGKFRELVAADQTQASIGILSLRRDAATGRVWAGTRVGLYWYDPTIQTFRPFVAPGQAAGARPLLAGRTIECVWPDGRGHLWLATPEGVERLQLATGARTVFGPAAAAPRRAALDGARCLYLAPDGRLWVGTRAHGLAVIEPNEAAAAVLTLGQGLPNASVATITPGPGGHLWLGTYQGLVRYQPATRQLAVFTTAHGLASDECNAQAAYIDPLDGSLLIGGVAGLHRIYPAQVPGQQLVPSRILLTGLTALSASADASRTQYLLPLDPLPHLHLAPNAPLVDLHLALTNTLDATRTRYAYRVRGWLADQWLGLGTTPLLRLQGLPPGHYTVEVRGETSQGVPTANLLRLPLTVTADWWNRPLTWVLAGVAAVAAVYLWQRSRLQRVQRENALRTRLAADLHDEVGSLLTRVTMQAELLHELAPGPSPRLATLVEDSRAAATTVRDIIWSVDTAADTLGALVDRMRDHLAATAHATGRPLVFDEADLPLLQDKALPPTVRQHVYLVFKEAVNNALKYARPGSAIGVALCCAPLLELTVTSESNPGAAPARSGQGLRNMRHRATLLGAALEAGPVPGGWRVQLRLLA